MPDPSGHDAPICLVTMAEMRKKETATRWFDDYEIACASFEEAERALSDLQAQLSSFRLHLNPLKTRIVELPDPTLDFWQGDLLATARRLPERPLASQMLEFFDQAFALRHANPGVPVLNYAIGLLFRIGAPTSQAARVAASAITQAMLAEPGTVQKATSLLTFWE
jgi:hypothetical protein